MFLQDFPLYTDVPKRFSVVYRCYFRSLSVFTEHLTKFYIADQCYYEVTWFTNDFYYLAKYARIEFELTIGVKKETTVHFLSTARIKCYMNLNLIVY